MSLVEIHGRLANTILYYLIIMAFWGLWRFFRKQGPNSNYWGALFIGEALILLQGALGAYLWFIGARPDRSIHILYGIVIAMVAPAVYLFTRGDDRRQVMLIYGVSLLFAVGLAFRSMTTGG